MTTNPLRGIASFTPQELAGMNAIYTSRPKGDDLAALASIVNSATKSLAETPAPIAVIAPAGDDAIADSDRNNPEAARQALIAYRLALAHAFTRDPRFLAHDFILGWARGNTPNGNAVAAVMLLPLYRAYDILHDQFTPAEQAVIDAWLRATAEAVIASQRDYRASGKEDGYNNHRSHSLLVVAAIGCILGDRGYVNFAVKEPGFKDHIGTNLATYPGEPPAFGRDFHNRKAVHYVAFNLQSLAQLAVLMDRLGRATGTHYFAPYNAFLTEIRGASVVRTLRALLPYAAGEAVSDDEFGGTDNPNDLARVGSGVLPQSFDRMDAVGVLEAAYYFTPVVVNAGRSYDLAATAYGILRALTKNGYLTPATPTPDFALARLTSPFLAGSH